LVFVAVVQKIEQGATMARTVVQQVQYLLSEGQAAIVIKLLTQNTMIFETSRCQYLHQLAS
jgi:hypothetical protein